MNKYLGVLLCLIAAACFFYAGAILSRYVINTLPVRIVKRAYSSIRNRIIISKPPVDPIYPVMGEVEMQKIKSAIKISFIGDLILLRDMVERAYVVEKETYCFDGIFYYVKDYLESDLSIGVLEGPLAGKERGWSTSDYYDGRMLRLNFPDSFAESIKNAGINLVTLANNHIFDQGYAGQERTIDLLDSIGLEHIGSYKTKGEHDKVKILNIRGKKIAFLAYTYGSEGYIDDVFMEGDNRYRTAPCLSRNSTFFNENKKRVAEDFKRVKAENPDLLIVMPHMGEQFLHTPDADQREWCDFFVELGADIIFSDHPHAVQPIEWTKNPSGHNTLIIHCPGNFVNSYIDYDGDASMVVETYIDEQTGELFAASIIPLYSYANHNNGVFTAIPLYNLMTDSVLNNKLSESDYKRIANVHKLITKTALGVELPIDNLQEHYFLWNDIGYMRMPVKPLEYKPEYERSKLYSIMKESSSICFVGNSVTEGTKNGGYGWYEPLAAMFPNKIIKKFALGGTTSNYLKEKRNEIANYNADFYVISIWCNDIRYRDPLLCAMSVEAFVTNVDALSQAIKMKNPTSKIMYISPWESWEPDPYNKSGKDKDNLYKEYGNALSNYCLINGYYYYDPNQYILESVKKDGYNWNKYFKDHIHPNALAGIRLISEACIMSSIDHH